MLEFMNVDIYEEDHLRKVNASKVNALVKMALTIAQPWCHSFFLHWRHEATLRCKRGKEHLIFFFCSFYIVGVSGG